MNRVSGVEGGKERERQKSDFFNQQRKNIHLMAQPNNSSVVLELNAGHTTESQ
jgi:hypothetical protein